MGTWIDKNVSTIFSFQKFENTFCPIDKIEVTAMPYEILQKSVMNY